MGSSRHLEMRQILHFRLRMQRCTSLSPGDQDCHSA